VIATGIPASCRDKIDLVMTSAESRHRSRHCVAKATVGRQVRSRHVGLKRLGDDAAAS